MYTIKVGSAPTHLPRACGMYFSAISCSQIHLAKKLMFEVDRVENTLTCCKVAKAKSRTANRYDGQTEERL